MLRTSTFVYDVADRLEEQIPPARDANDNPQDRRTESHYNVDGTLASTTIQVGQNATATTSYQYDQLKRQTVVTDANNGATTTRYLKGGQVESVTDPASNRTAFQYDQLGRQTKEIVGQAGAGLTRSTLYDPLDRFRVAIDRNGRAIRYTLDNLGRPVTEEWFATAALSGTPSYVATFTYDAAGQLASASDSRGGTPVSSYTVNERDNLGRDLDHTESLAGRGDIDVSQSFNSQNDRANLMLTAGNTTVINNSYMYDDLHRMTEVASSLAVPREVDLRYNFDGKLASIKRNAFIISSTVDTNYTYYDDGTLKLLKHEGELSFGYTFDSAGRIASQTTTDIAHSKPPQTVTYNYDKQGQLQKSSQDPPEVQIVYDANGNRLDSGNRIGPNNQLLGDRLYEYEYDQEGNRTKKTLRQTVYVIDNRSPGFATAQQQKWVSRPQTPDSASSGFGPDALVNNINLQAAGDPIYATFTEDKVPAGDYEIGITWRADTLGATSLARVAYYNQGDTFTSYSTPVPLNFESAPFGQKDNNGTVWQVLKAQVHFTGTGYVQVQLYDVNNKSTDRNHIILDAVRLRRLGDGRFNTPDQSVINVGSPLMKLEGNWTAASNGTRRSVPVLNEPAIMKVDIPMLDPGEYRVLVKWNEPVNDTGGKQSPPFVVADTSQVVGAKQFDQSQLGQDTADSWAIVGVFPIASGTLHLEVVNILNGSGPNPYAPAAISSVQIERVTDNTPITTYVWDHKNRLTDAVRREANYTNIIQTIHYTYDVLGHRIERESDFTDPNRADTKEFYLFDGDQEVVTLDGQQALKERQLYGPAVDQVLAIDAPGMLGATYTWPLLDPQGTVERLVDGLGQAWKDFDYDVFGRPFTTRARPQDSDNLNLDAFYAYTGRSFDFDTRLQDNRARLYDPFTHQFISQDPTGLASGDTNLYRYAGNSPTNATDPSGHIINVTAGLIGAAAGAVIGGASYVGNWAWNGGYETDWNTASFALSVGAGAAAGGIGGLTFGASLYVMTGSAVVGLETAASSVYIAGVAQGLAAGYSGSFLSAAGQARLDGKSWGDSLAAGHQAGRVGGVTGAIGSALAPLVSAGMGSLLGQATGKLACNMDWSETAKLMAMHMAADAAGDLIVDSSVQAISIAAGLQEDWNWQSTITSGITGLGQGAANFMMSRACFTGETKLVVPEGLKRIDLFRKDDLVGSRNEHDPDGPLEWKRVLQVFKRVAPIVELTVRGMVIRTTLEHPFRPVGGIWTATNGLEVGQLLVVLDGEPVMVDSIRVTDEFETVYNLEVEDNHTYFVSGEEWGFAVWAHNAASTIYSGNWGELDNSRRRGLAAVPGAQIDHLNQDAVYGRTPKIPGNEGRVIPYRKGAAVLLGGATAAQDSGHNLKHRVLEGFWDEWRKTYALTGEAPTNAQYGEALFRGLIESGEYSLPEAYKLAQAARRQRISYGHLDNHRVPNIPNPFPSKFLPGGSL